MKKILLTICFLASIAFQAQTNTFDDSKVNGVAGAGANDDTWETATNWSLGIVPTAAHDVVIPDGMLAKIKVSGALANTITASGTGKIQINAEKSLTVTGNLTGGSNSNIFFVPANGKNMGTLIFGGTYTGGNTSAKTRLPNNNKWHLISPPLKQATINNFINDASTIVANGDDNKYSLGTYDDANAVGAKYTYFAKPYPNTTDKLEKGQGYATLLNNVSDATKPDMQFKGKFNDADVFSATLVHANDGFVLLGNPFTAYVYANVNADATKNILTVNSGKLEEQTIWLWDSANSMFVTKNQSSDAYHLSPGQGYFIKVKSTVTGKFRTNEDMQTHTKTDGMLKTSNNRFEIDLSISKDTKEGVLSRNTSIKFIDDTTTSFDNGYDSSLFGGYGSNFAVFTELVENNAGKKLAIQSLPNSSLENMVIPVGVNANAGSEITFTANALNVPVGYKVILEDRLNNTQTRLDELNSEYKTTVTDASTIGRFFLHAKSSALNVESELLTSVSIYKTSNSTLRIAGLQKGNAKVSIFNMLGKQVMQTSFEASNANDISLPKLATGVYLVKLQTENSKLNKKIILE